jgi:hypothetical protein
MSKDLRETAVVRMAQRSSAFIKSTASTLYTKSLSLFARKKVEDTESVAASTEPAAAEKALVGSIVQEILQNEDDEGQAAVTSNQANDDTAKTNFSSQAEEAAGEAVAKMVSKAEEVEAAVVVTTRVDSPIGISAIAEDAMYYNRKISPKHALDEQQEVQ